MYSIKTPRKWKPQDTECLNEICKFSKVSPKTPRLCGSVSAPATHKHPKDSSLNLEHFLPFFLFLTRIVLLVFEYFVQCVLIIFIPQIFPNNTPLFSILYTFLFKNKQTNKLSHPSCAAQIVVCVWPHNEVWSVYQGLHS